MSYSTGLAIGSVPPNDQTNCVRGVVFRNITMYRPLKALYIKSNPGTSGSGIIEDISFEDIFIQQALWWTVWIGKVTLFSWLSMFFPSYFVSPQYITTHPPYIISHILFHRSNHMISQHIISNQHQITPHNLTYCNTSHHATTHHNTSHHITPRHITSHHTTSHHIVGPQQQNQPGDANGDTGCNFLFPYVPICPTNPLVTMRNIRLKNIVAVDTLPLFQGPGE